VICRSHPVVAVERVSARPAESDIHPIVAMTFSRYTGRDIVADAVAHGAPRALGLAGEGAD